MADNDIVLRKFRDLDNGTEFDINTAFIEREVKVPTRVKVPLYRDGQILPAGELKKLRLEVIEITEAEFDAKHYAALYAANPDLATRVREYKKLLDLLALPYDATTDAITAAVQAKADLDETGKLALAEQLRIAFQNVVLNLEACGQVGANYEAWLQMPKLVRYLPAEPEPEPKPEPEPQPQPEAQGQGQEQAAPAEGDSETASDGVDEETRSDPESEKAAEEGAAPKEE